jgi:hypothetical protein
VNIHSPVKLESTYAPSFTVIGSSNDSLLQAVFHNGGRVRMPPQRSK